MSARTPRLRAQLDDGTELVAVAGERVVVRDGGLWDLLVAGRHDGGHLWLDGRPVPSRPAQRVRRGLVVLGPEAPVAPEVSVRDHLAAIVSVPAADDLLARTPRLAGRGGDPAGVLSGGERRLLAWARARASHPTVAVLAGARGGLDPEAIAWTEEVVDAWLADGVVVVELHPRVGA